ncbi:hypothetical protein ABZU25_17120 [Micromonospora sp. NPDC005215]|uniref:hypothetical protein n=1 Tax=Micromonospora sp. NPDC005215 TaxID=3157024 RepID=UPI0033B84AEF
MNDKIEMVSGELIAAVFDLRMVMATQQPQWNSWPPRLMALGRAFVEYQAGRHSSGGAHGAAMASRVVEAFHERSKTAAETVLGVPVQRLTTAISRAVLLPDEAVTAAAAELGVVAMEAMGAYAEDSLYRPKAAAARRLAADTALEEAVGALTQAVRQRRDQPLTPKRQRWWRRRRSV